MSVAGAVPPPLSQRTPLDGLILWLICTNQENSETDDFVGCIGTVRVLFMG